jgi:DNA-binding response OmpR family regulator
MANAPAPQTVKVLIIEDDDVIRFTLTNALKKKGYICFIAENGNTGLEVYKAQNPHVVITDMLMPDKEGLETISDIRAINKDTKIIAMSGGGTTQNLTFLQMAKKMGANLLLSKPIKPDQLTAAIESLWEN